MAQMPQYRNLLEGVDTDPWKMLGQYESLQKLQDSHDDRRALEEAGKLYPDDPRALVGELYKRGRSQLAMGVEKNLFEIRKSAAEAQEKQLANMKNRLTMAASIASGITDDATFQAGRNQIANILGPDLAAELGDVYDPQRVAQAVAWGSTETGRIQQQQNAISAYQKAVEFEHTKSKDAPGIFKEWVTAYANTMGVARNAQEWAAARDLARKGGVPASVIDMLPADFSPEAPEMASGLAMTAKERADVANAQGDDARAAEQFGTTSAETARHNRAMEARAGATAPVSVIDPSTGQPVYVRPEQAYGMKPGSTREQGRAVTSTDAGTLAELQSSLDDLSVMKDELLGPAGPDGKRTPTGAGTATGTAARLGAMVPDAITEWWGVGSNAKQKQALIDRVRQVIGKALEGGVLRKEDEEKYKKILPVIQDPPEIVSTKLNNLEKAISAKSDRLLEALEDANYDVTKYRGRRGTPQAPPAEPPSATRPAGGNPFRK